MVGYVLAAALVAVAALLVFRRITIFEYERGVRYRHGKAAGVLDPGVHWILPWVSSVVRVDVRPAFLAVPGQEVLTADGVGLKITLVAKYQVTDPQRALNAVAAYRDALYTQLQLALREIVGAAPVDAVLASRLHGVSRGEASARKGGADWAAWAALQNAARTLVLQSSTCRDLAGRLPKDA